MLAFPSLVLKSLPHRRLFFSGKAPGGVFEGGAQARLEQDQQARYGQGADDEVQELPAEAVGPVGIAGQLVEHDDGDVGGQAARVEK